jgi:hypothetical protein
VFTTRYALSPYIKQIRFVFKWLNLSQSSTRCCVKEDGALLCWQSNLLNKTDACDCSTASLRCFILPGGGENWLCSAYKCISNQVP